MISRVLASFLLASLLVTSVPTGAQGNSQEELDNLRRMAEESFSENDLELAATLYRQLAYRMENPRERATQLIYAAYVQFLMGKNNATLETISEALVSDPQFPFEADLYSESFSKIFYDAQQRAAAQRAELAEAAVRAGTEALRSRRYDDARSRFEEALGHHANHPTATYNLALVDLYEGRQEQAEFGFQKLLSLGEAAGQQFRVLAFTNLGFLYERRGQVEEAAGFLEQAVELDPKAAKAWSILGAAQRQLGDKAAAAEAFRRAYELTPEDPQAMSHLALAYIDAQSWRAASDLLEKATVADATNANLWLHLGVARLGVGESSGAVAAFEAAIRLDPNDAAGKASNAATHLSRHYYQEGDFRRALHHADQALGWRSDLVTAQVFQGLARQSLGDLAGARQSLEAARRLDPTQAETLNNLGSVYFQLGLFDKAIEAFERTLTLRPDFPGARDNLAAAQQGSTGVRTSPSPTPAPQRGAPPARTARLGIRFADIDYAALGLKGAMVERVESGGPAGRAGVIKNDLILKIDGRDVTHADDLKRYVASRPLGSTVVLSLLRANIPQRIDVRLD